MGENGGGVRGGGGGREGDGWGGGGGRTLTLFETDQSAKRYVLQHQ